MATTARQLGREGFRIWLGSRDTDQGEAAAHSLTAEGVNARVLTIDVTSDDSVRAAVDRVAQEDAKLDILINNAGISGLQTARPSEQPLDDIRVMYETNVFAPIRVTQAFLPLLKAADGGSVVIVMADRRCRPRDNIFRPITSPISRR